MLSFDEAFDCISQVVRTGMQWRDLQPRTVSHITVFKTMHQWVSQGVFRTAYTRLLKLYGQKRRPKFYSVDSSYVKNIYGRDCTGRNPTDRGRRATKLSTVVDDLGIPHALLATEANVSDQRLLEVSLRSTLVPLCQKTELFADKGYDSAANRKICRSLGLKDRIFKRKTVNGRRTHAKRGVVERFFSWHDKNRRLLVRYEQKVGVYLQLSFLAIGQLLSKRQIFGGSQISGHSGQSTSNKIPGNG